jgi:L-aspartate oxidase
VDRFVERFPSLALALADAGFDPARDWLPVAPAAHYLCGGILTDLDGATALPGLWAAGEVACSGVQGANRLASNSLLEGLVFGARSADAIVSGKQTAEASGALAGQAPSIPVRELGPVDAGGEGPTALGVPPLGVSPLGVAAARAELQRAFSDGAGVVRSAASLSEVASALDRVAEVVGRELAGERAPKDLRAVVELANLVAVGRALVVAASARRESRGAHTRGDFPDRDDSMRVRQLVRVVAPTVSTLVAADDPGPAAP